MILGLSLVQIGAVAAIALVASILGGVAGYGTGLLLPPILVPLIGAEAVVPVISLSALLTNASRLIAFRDALAPRVALRVAALALPGTLAGAALYTRMSGAGASILIGTMLIVLVPLRRGLMRRHGGLSPRALGLAAAGYGALNGATSGSGVVLLSILLATGLGGSAVIATDAGVSLTLGLAKVAVFQSAGALPAGLWLLALLIGLAALPGAFIARRVAARLSPQGHVALLDGVVMLGGVLLLTEGLRTL